MGLFLVCAYLCVLRSASSNNWVLIKVVKLLGSLVPLEPRLAKKLTEPLSDIITTTPAKSLLYECVNTLLCGELRSKTVVKLCLEKLRNFIEDADQNRTSAESSTGMTGEETRCEFARVCFRKQVSVCLLWCGFVCVCVLQ